MGPVSPISIRPDEKEFITSNGYVYVWNVESKGARLLIRNDSDLEFGAMYLPSGNQFATISSGGQLRYRDSESAQLNSSVSLEANGISTFAFSPEGRVLVTNGKNSRWTHVWDATTYALLYTFDTGYEATSSLDLSPDGQLVAVGTEYGNAQVYRLSTGAIVSTPKLSFPGSYCRVAFSHNSRLLALATNHSWEGVYRGGVFDAMTGVPAWEGYTGATMVFSPDDDELVCGSYYSNKVWMLDPKNGQEVRTIACPFSASPQYFPDGKTLISGSLYESGNSADYSIRTWHMPEGAPSTTFTGPNYDTSSISFSPDGTMFATAGSSDGIARLWVTKDGSYITSMVDMHEQVDRVAFNPKGDQVLCCRHFGSGVAYDIASRTTTVIGDDEYPVHLGTYTPEGKFVVGLDLVRGRVLRRDLISSQVVAADIRDMFSLLEVSSTGDTALVASQTEIAAINIGTMRTKWTFSDPSALFTSIALNPDGKICAVTDRGNSILFSLETGTIINSATLFTTGSALSVKFEGNSRLAVVSSQAPNDIQFFRVPELVKIKDLAAPFGSPVRRFEISPDRTKIVAVLTNFDLVAATNPARPKLVIKVELNGFSGQRQLIKCDYSLTNVRGVISAGQTYLTPDGNLEIQLSDPLEAGSFSLRIKPQSALTTVLLGDEKGILTGSVNCVNGDCNQDNYIGTDDYLILSRAYTSKLGEARYDARADLSGDEEISMLDYMILVDGFDTLGE